MRILQDHGLEIDVSGRESIKVRLHAPDGKKRTLTLPGLFAGQLLETLAAAARPEVELPGIGFVRAESKAKNVLSVYSGPREGSKVIVV